MFKYFFTLNKGKNNYYYIYFFCSVTIKSLKLSLSVQTLVKCLNTKPFVSVLLSSIFGDWISLIFLWLKGFQKDIKSRNTSSIISLFIPFLHANMEFIHPYPVWLDILAFYVLPLNVFIIKKTKLLITPIKLYFFFLIFLL